MENLYNEIIKYFDSILSSYKNNNQILNRHVIQGTEEQIADGILVYDIDSEEVLESQMPTGNKVRVSFVIHLYKQEADMPYDDLGNMIEDILHKVLLKRQNENKFIIEYTGNTIGRESRGEVGLMISQLNFNVTTFREYHGTTDQTINSVTGRVN